MKNKPMQDGTRWQVAAFYSEGWEPYGGITTFNTEAEARSERTILLSLGFQHVHIWSVTTKLIQE